MNTFCTPRCLSMLLNDMVDHAGDDLASRSQAFFNLDCVPDAHVDKSLVLRRVHFDRPYLILILRRIDHGHFIRRHHLLEKRRLQHSMRLEMEDPQLRRLETPVRHLEVLLPLGAGWRVRVLRLDSARRRGRLSISRECAAGWRSYKD